MHRIVYGSGPEYELGAVLQSKRWSEKPVTNCRCSRAVVVISSDIGIGRARLGRKRRATALEPTSRTGSRLTVILHHPPARNQRANAIKILHEVTERRCAYAYPAVGLVNIIGIQFVIDKNKFVT